MPDEHLLPNKGREPLIGAAEVPRKTFDRHAPAPDRTKTLFFFFFFFLGSLFRALFCVVFSLFLFFFFFFFCFLFFFFFFFFLLFVFFFFFLFFFFFIQRCPERPP